MSYQRDDLHVATADSYVDDSKADYRRIPVGEVYLEHSCGEWVIGGKAEVQQLISDLTEILEQWPG